MLEVRVKNELTPALIKFRDKMLDALIAAGGEAVTVIIARAVSDFMRDAAGEPIRRSPADGGPLRIVTGRLARSLVGARTDGRGPESIYRVQKGGTQVTITFGSVVPYANIHERGGQAGRGHSVTIPGRPYLGPAIELESARAINIFDQALDRLARQLDL